MKPGKLPRRRPRGSALLITIIFVAMFACLAVAIAVTSNMGLVVSRNTLEIRQAAWLAEGGMFQSVQLLGGSTVTGSTAGEVHASLAALLETAFTGSAMVDPSDITADAGGAHAGPISVPLAGGESGTVNLTLVSSGGVVGGDAPTITVTSVGQYRNARRQASCRMTISTAGRVYAHGILSKSPVVFGNNCVVRGANNPSEGSIGVAAMTGGTVFTIGSGTVDGAVSIVDPHGGYSTGKSTIGGGVVRPCDPPNWPEIDVSIFRPYATNICPAEVSGTVNNLIVRPGTNPNFANNVTVRGVLYIQPPNVVTFTNNATIIGCIVSETPTVESPTANQIIFKNNVTTSGVEDLPGDACFNGLRELRGSFLLAPGFYVEFKNNFNTINGSMIASAFQLKNNAVGSVRGGIINLGYDSYPTASQFEFKNNAGLTIDLSDANNHHAGVSGGSPVLSCVPHSCEED